MNNFFYVIDLDSGGEFRCHVETELGRILWNARTNDETGEFWPINDGIMESGSDVAGLESYLKEYRILPRTARLNLFREKPILEFSK